MVNLLSIGDFSRATHITVKMLRHYHSIGLLQPAEVNRQNGYRAYSVQQIGVAQVIRRFRELDMPLNEIRAVLEASDVATRNEKLIAHLARLERELGRTQQAVSSLRGLLSMDGTGESHAVSRRSIPQTTAAAITGMVGAADSAAWLQGALAELFAVLAARNLSPSDVPGGIYADELFTDGLGMATIFVPTLESVPPIGRVTAAVIPAAELAIITHVGPPSEVDSAYGTLAGWVSQHALAIGGPIREYYQVGPRQTGDSAAWRTEIGWPIFSTGIDQVGTPLATTE